MTTYIAVSIAAVILAFIWCMLFAWAKVKPHDTGCLGDAVYDWYYDIPAPALPFDTPVP